jgi:hypothetical protein
MFVRQLSEPRKKNYSLYLFIYLFIIYMSKVYDKIEWDFLKALMWNLGFDDRWIQLILCNYKWSTKSTYFTDKRYQRRGSIISLPFYSMCGGP